MEKKNSNCLICESKNSRYLGAVDCQELPGVKFSYFHCNDCKSRFFDPWENDIDIVTENEKFSLDEHYVTAPFVKNPYWDKQVDIIKKISGSKINSILDCGCRTGDFLMHWPQGIHRVGVEIVPDVARVAALRGIKVINEPLEEARDLGKFDVVTCYAILEHLHAPTKVMGALSESVDNNGLLVVMIPSFETFKAKLLNFFGFHWHQLYPPFHLCFFSRKFLDDYFEKQGFDIVKVEYRSGGMFNPFSKVPILYKVWSKVMVFVDNHSPTRFLPIFDHMYLYYRKK